MEKEKQAKTIGLKWGGIQLEVPQQTLPRSKDTAEVTQLWIEDTMWLSWI